MSQNTNLDDASELIQYGGDQWGVDHKSDPFTPQYYEGTFHTTTVHLAWSRICWEGQDISVHGAKRDNHGLYAISVDNAEPELFDGYSKKEQIQAVLYTTAGLEWGQHQLTIWNANKFNFTKNHIWLDVDFATLNGSPISCDGLPEISVTPSESAFAIPTESSTAITISSIGTTDNTSIAPSNTSTIAGSTTSSSLPISATTTTTLGTSAPITSSAVSSSAASSSANTTSATTGASSAAQRFTPGYEGHLALAGLAGLYLFKRFH